MFINRHSCYLEDIIRDLPRNDSNEERLVDMATENPTTSVRHISRRLGVPRFTVHRILRRNLLYIYHVQCEQALLPTDYEKGILSGHVEIDKTFFQAFCGVTKAVLKYRKYIFTINIIGNMLILTW